MIKFIKKVFWSNPGYRHIYWRLKHLIDPDWAKVYFDDRNLDDGRNRHKLIEFINKLNQNKILEIGCSSGDNLFLLEEKKKYEILEGIDISNYCINEGKKILKGYNSNVILKQGNAAKPNYKNRSFDIVFISGVAMDLTDKDLISTVTECLRISNKYFILHTSNYKLDPSLNIKSKAVSYKNHFLRDYHLFFKENFEKYPIEVLKLKEDIPEYGTEIEYFNLDYLIVLKQIN
jgi:ubiquinone/menaquinone biosynthesis C-methylase UbiE